MEPAYFPDIATPDTAAGARRMPLAFEDWRNFHDGESILVCGCGSSLSRIVAPERLVTIGVNDVGRLFDPDYLVVLNPRHQFSAGRFEYVENSRARALFTQLDLKIGHPHQVRIRLEGRGSIDLANPHALPYTRNSTYPAVCLAAHMGARRIGMIGVDFTDHHFFAPTGTHPLGCEIAQIDREFRQLHDSCAARGIELYNLSEESRLTGIPKMPPEKFAAGAFAAVPFPGRRVFFVHYRFLSCGTVFRDGLAHAAEALQLDWREAYWDDLSLEEKIAAFQPELVFVVHGRKFASRWGDLPKRYPTAVWLLDEPYEVDDTSRFSGLFEHVFVNDPGTLRRHHNATHLPVCYEPALHWYRPGAARPHQVGFIGGHNPWREQALARLARAGLLSYVVGGPWSHPDVRALSLSPNIPAEETAELYRATKLVINLFRTRHHYNASAIAAESLNPRIYEALGCGSLVVSERRPELAKLCPEVPVFDTIEEMEHQVERHLREERLFAEARRSSIRRLAPHTYEQRLARALSAIFGRDQQRSGGRREAVITMPAPLSKPELQRPGGELPQGWKAHDGFVEVHPDGEVMLHRERDGSPGSERGLIGETRHGDVAFEFDVYLHRDTEFVAKIHQPEADNQLGNSYHLLIKGGRGYLARHDHIFKRISFEVDCWTTVMICYHEGIVTVRRNGAEVARAADRMLEDGHCFLGVKAGTARVKKIRLLSVPAPAGVPASGPAQEYELISAGARERTPVVSIVTTVYDRIDCLERCLRSTEALNFRDYEQIVVADAPPPPVLEQIAKIVAKERSGRATFATLTARHNDWGIAPAAAGLSLARGRYVCFLSDDNGYVPTHFDRLIATLESDPGLGFVYSSCLYDGRLTLSTSPPRPGRIDLGQPVFRRELFERFFGGGLPFHEFGWDWRMIECFMRQGVRWRHINDATFVFRLAKYPHLTAPAAVMSRR